MENCVERESYALTAGLALGLVTLGKGETAAPGLADLKLPDILHRYMTGGRRDNLTGKCENKHLFKRTDYYPMEFILNRHAKRQVQIPIVSSA